MHPSSLTDQIYNNASGVLNIEEKIQQLVDVKQEIEYLGLVHYSNMDLIRLRKIENIFNGHETKTH